MSIIGEQGGGRLYWAEVDQHFVTEAESLCRPPSTAGDDAVVWVAGRQNNVLHKKQFV